MKAMTEFAGSRMRQVTIYTRQFCGYCSAAKRLLQDKGVAFQEFDTTVEPRRREEMIAGQAVSPSRRSLSASSMSAAATISSSCNRAESSTACWPPDMTTFRAACIQLCSTTDISENIETVDRLVREAVRGGAQYVQTPEMTNVVQRDRAALAASLAFDSTIRRWRASPHSRPSWDRAARRLASLKGGGRAHRQSRAPLRSGRHVIARYDKIHLFDVDLPNGESWRESAVYVPGDRAVLAELPWLSLGVSICYDIRFPHLFRAQAHAGAAALTAPAAFTRQTGEAHWDILQRARAIENGAFVISAAQAGRHQDGRETYGHSIIVAPWGDVLAEASGEGPEVILADIDPALSADARQRIPSLKNERPFATPDAGETVRLRSARDTICAVLHRRPSV
jgi:predicted amidohydrolase